MSSISADTSYKRSVQTMRVPKVIYSGCQKNVPLPKRFFLQPLMPQSFIPEHFYDKGYKVPKMPKVLESLRSTFLS